MEKKGNEKCSISCEGLENVINNEILKRKGVGQRSVRNLSGENRRRATLRHVEKLGKWSVSCEGWENKTNGET